MPVFLLPLLTGGALGFGAGAWTSGTLGSLLKIAMIGAVAYFIFIKMM